MKQVLLLWTDELGKITHELEVDLPLAYPERVPENAFITDEKISSAKFSLGPLISVGGVGVQTLSENVPTSKFDRKLNTKNPDDELATFVKDLQDQFGISIDIDKLRGILGK